MTSQPPPPPGPYAFPTPRAVPKGPVSRRTAPGCDSEAGIELGGLRPAVGRERAQRPVSTCASPGHVGLASVCQGHPLTEAQCATALPFWGLASRVQAEAHSCALN